MEFSESITWNHKGELIDVASGEIVDLDDGGYSEQDKDADTLNDDEAWHTLEEDTDSELIFIGVEDDESYHEIDKMLKSKDRFERKNICVEKIFSGVKVDYYLTVRVTMLDLFYKRKRFLVKSETFEQTYQKAVDKKQEFLKQRDKEKFKILSSTWLS